MKSNNGLSVLAFILLILGMAVSAYLVVHHYEIMFGMREAKSFCSVGPHMDCDAVNSSAYSEVLGIPVALISVFALGAELLLLIGFRAFGDEEKSRLARFFLYLCTANMAAIVILGIIQSVVIKLFCILCFSFYFIALLLFFCAYKLVKGPKFAKFGSDLKSLFLSSEKNGSRGVLILLILIPVGSALANGIYKDKIAKGLDKFVAEAVTDWQANKQYTFSIGTAPEIGNPSAHFQIIEFSDFQCPHCRRAAPSLHAFVNSHRDQVHFIFQNYPLDPNCNPKIPKGGGHDKACLMATAGLCALRQNRFAEAHDWIFDHQDVLSDSSPTDMVNDLKLDKSAFESCMGDQSVKDEVQKEVDQGNLANVEGTPTVFVNGRVLPGGFLIPVLEAALKATQNQN